MRDGRGDRVADELLRHWVRDVERIALPAPVAAGEERVSRVVPGEQRPVHGEQVGVRACEEWCDPQPWLESVVAAPRRELGQAGRKAIIGLPVADRLLPAVVDLEDVERQPPETAEHVDQTLFVDAAVEGIPAAPNPRATGGACPEPIGEQVAITGEDLGLRSRRDEPLAQPALVLPCERTVTKLDSGAQPERAEKLHCVVAELDRTDAAATVNVRLREGRVVDHWPPLLDGVPRRSTSRIEPPRLTP